MSKETKRRENSLSGTPGHTHVLDGEVVSCKQSRSGNCPMFLLATPQTSRAESVQNPPSAPTSLLHEVAAGDTTRVRLAAEVPFASPGSEDLDFLDLSFFGVVASGDECEGRRLGIFQGASKGLIPAGLTPSLPPFDMSRPLRAFVIANAAVNPGIGGWPGASMKSWLPVCDG